MDEQTATEVIDAAVRLHTDLGPGLFESVYERLLQKVLEDRGLEVRRQVVMPLEYQGIKFEEGYRLDLLVNEEVIVELKACDQIHPAHRRQLITYLRLSGIRLGLLLNFGAAVMRDNIARVVSNRTERPGW